MSLARRAELRAAWRRGWTALTQSLAGRAVGTRVGDVLLDGRDRVKRLSAAWAPSEQLGTVANDHLARYLLPRVVSPGGVFVDVGAHLGSVFAEVSAVRPDVRCHAVEAVPTKAAALRARFPTVRVHACAVADEEGELPFYVDLEAPGYSALRRPRHAAPGAVREVRVPVRRLDAVVPDRDVDAIKIDTEGAELDVLRGATEILEASGPTLFFESAPTAVDRAPALWHLLEARGYEVFVPNRLAHTGPSLSVESFVESHAFPRRTTNYFAVQRSRRDTIRARALAAVRALPDSLRPAP